MSKRQKPKKWWKWARDGRSAMLDLGDVRLHVLQPPHEDRRRLGAMSRPCRWAAGIERRTSDGRLEFASLAKRVSCSTAMGLCALWAIWFRRLGGSA